MRTGNYAIGRLFGQGTQVDYHENYVMITSLALEKCGSSINNIVLILNTEINSLETCCEIALGWMLEDLAKDTPTLIQVMAWCQTTTRYLRICWRKSLHCADIWKGFLMETTVIWLKSHLVNKRPVLNRPALVQIMTSRLTGDEYYHNQIWHISLTKIWFTLIPWVHLECFRNTVRPNYPQVSILTFLLFTDYPCHSG